MSLQSPHLGIFWGYQYDGKLVLAVLKAPANTVDTIGGFKTMDTGHVDAWAEITRVHPQVAHLEYDEVPRGRVNWREADRNYLILADPKLLDISNRKTLLEIFNLQGSKVTFLTDEHYRTGRQR